MKYFQQQPPTADDKRRPREGAWIEMSAGKRHHCQFFRRPREGAWIEILAWSIVSWLWVGRPREGAWIEIPRHHLLQMTGRESPPRGGVD